MSASSKFRGQAPRGGLGPDVIETIDWSVGEILKAVKEQGQDNNKRGPITSDNGPSGDPKLSARMLANVLERALGEGDSAGAKGTSYEGGSRVPGIARWPGTIARGR